MKVRMNVIGMLGIVCVLALSLGLSAAATTWDAYADWSNTSNPNGPYAYGTRTSILGTDITAYDTNGVLWAGYETWSTSGVWWAGGTLSKNSSMGALVQQPGGGCYSVLRWTSPINTSLNLDITWSNTAWASAGANVLFNGVSIFNGPVNWAGPTIQQCLGNLNVLVGDTIEAVLSDGGNGTPGDDMVALRFVLSTTSNLLLNSSFESGAPASDGRVGDSGESSKWKYEFLGEFSGIAGEVAGQTIAARTGSNKLCLFGYDATEVTPGIISVYQNTSVVANSQYTASVYVRGVDFAGNGSGFGKTGDVARLLVREIDSLGNPTVELANVEITTASADYQLLTATFTPTTNKIRYELYVSIGCAFTDGCVLFDDCRLEGQYPPTPLVGKVTSGATPVVGATVTYGILSATTDSNGNYEILGVPTGQYQSVRASKAGYFPQRKWREMVTEGNTVDIDIPAVGNNLLTDPDFEDSDIPNGTNGWSMGAVSGWTTDLPVWNVWNESANSTFEGGGTAYFHTGEEAEDVIVWHYSGVPNDGSLSQTINVRPSSHYTAKVWLKSIGPSWGVDPAQKGELVVRLIDFDGNATELSSQLNNSTDWQQQVIDFDTPANVDTVRFIVRAHMVDSPGAAPYARLIIDDAELNGLAGLGPTIFGKVTSGATPIAGATVTYGGLSATTDANGDYAISGVPMGQYLAVRVSKSGYYPQKRWRTINGTARCNVEIPAVGSNLLTNPGFEDTATAHGGNSYPLTSDGWTDSVGLPNYWNESGNNPAYYKSGEEAQDIIGWYYAAPPCDGALSQTVMVMPNSHYTAKVWLKSDGPSWGVDPAQIGELVVQLIDTDSNVTELTSALSNFIDWQQKVIEFDTPSNVNTVKFMVRAHIVDTYFARLIIDAAELNGLARGLALADAKKMADGSSVFVSNMVVTAVFDGFFYIEDQDRHSAIKVLGSASVGNVVSVRGTMATSEGERAINAASVDVIGGSGILLQPLGMTNKALGGGDEINNPGVTGGTGLNNLGLLVRTTGSVVGVTGSTLTIDDGSGTPVSVTGVIGTFTTSDYVVVTGISSVKVEPDTSRSRMLRCIRITDLN
ncbi:MAG: carboxypeptidase-like regulatory domain-containing protein [Armatimonadota bacterium]